MRIIKTYKLFLESDNADEISGTKTYNDLQTDLKIYNKYKERVRQNIVDGKNPDDGIPTNDKTEYNRNPLLKNYGLIQKYKKEIIELENSDLKIRLSEETKKLNDTFYDKEETKEKISELKEEVGKLNKKIVDLRQKITDLESLNKKLLLLPKTPPDKNSNKIKEIETEKNKIQSKK